MKSGIKKCLIASGSAIVFSFMMACGPNQKEVEKSYEKDKAELLKTKQKLDSNMEIKNIENDNAKDSLKK